MPASNTCRNHTNKLRHPWLPEKKIAREKKRRLCIIHGALLALRATGHPAGTPGVLRAQSGPKARDMVPRTMKGHRPSHPVLMSVFHRRAPAIWAIDLSWLRQQEHGGPVLAPRIGELLRGGCGRYTYPRDEKVCFTQRRPGMLALGRCRRQARNLGSGRG